MSEKVDQAQLMRYIEIEKEVQALEAQNVLKNYEVRYKAAADVEETIKSVDVTLQALTLATKKEKKDVDEMQKKSQSDIQHLFQDQASFNAKLSQEQEEYLEAKNKEEVARQQLQDLKKQQKELEGKANEIKESADKLRTLYEERDNLLSDIFGGEYGSDKENKLEAQYDALMERKQRVGVANYKWKSGRVLLNEAVKQMAYAVQKWTELKATQQMQVKYTIATEVRNNLVAAKQNVESTRKYLINIDFPYCKKEEMVTLDRAIANIYTDMADNGRHSHAMQCYDTTCRRAGALLQWFDNVINETISKDLNVVSKEAREVEQSLRAERIRLIREKIAESGGDVSSINDAGLKGMTDQTKLSEEDMDMKGVGISRPAPVGDNNGIPDAQQTTQEPMPPAPTPVPLAQLAQKPCDEDLFGDISELKKQHEKDLEEFQKAQKLNEARLQQGLQEKLAARRHRKK